MNTPRLSGVKAPSCNSRARCADAETSDGRGFYSLAWTAGAFLVCAAFVAAAMWS